METPNVTKYPYVVPAPRDRKMKEIRAWLLENVGEPGTDWALNVDREAVAFFETEVQRAKYENVRLTGVFNIGFIQEEDKVKFILSFL